MSVAAGISLLAAAAAAGTVYLGNNLESTPLETALTKPSVVNSNSTVKIEDVDKDLNVINTEVVEPLGITGSTEVPELLGITGSTELSEPSEPLGITGSTEVPEPPKIPEVETDPAPIPEVVEPENTKIKGGGQVGRPMWGEITSNAKVAGTTGGILGLITSTTQYLVPTDLQIQLRDIRNLIKQKQSDINETTEKIKKFRQIYTVKLKEYVKFSAEYDTLEKFTNYYKGKLDRIGDFQNDSLLKFLQERRKALSAKNPGQQQSKKKKKGGAAEEEEEEEEEVPSYPSWLQPTGPVAIPNEIEDINKAIAERIRVLEKEYTQGNLIERLGADYQTAAIQKEEKNDLKNEAKIEKDKAEQRIIEGRTKIETLKKELKELETKETELLLKLTSFKRNTNPQDELPIDFNRRRENYFRAKQLYEDALERYRDFMSSKLETQDSAIRDQLTNALKFAKKELSISIDFLTKTQKSSSFSSLEFTKFTQDVMEIFGQAITNRNPDFGERLQIRGGIQSILWGRNNPPNQNYYNAFQELLDYLTDLQIIKFANMYYLAKTEDDIEINIDFYLEFFNRVGTLFYLKFQKFEESLIQAHGTIRTIEMRQEGNPEPANQDQYTKLRNIAMIFLDKQVFGINNFRKLVAKTYNKLSREQSVSTHKIKLVNEKVNAIIQPITLPNGNGECQILLPSETYNFLLEGKFEKVPLLELLGDSQYEEKRQRFFEKIGFAQINDAIDAEQFLRLSRIELNNNHILNLIYYTEKLQEARENLDSILDEIDTVDLPLTHLQILELGHVRAISNLVVPADWQPQPGTQGRQAMPAEQVQILTAAEQPGIPWGSKAAEAQTQGERLPEVSRIRRRPTLQEIAIGIEMVLNEEINPGGAGPEGRMPALARQQIMFPEETGRQRVERLQTIISTYFGEEFKPGNYIKTKGIQPIRDSVQTIQYVINKCEVDGNVGVGKETNDKIKIILEKLNTFGLEPTIKNPLDIFIEAETQSGRININRNNPEVIQSLADVRFSQNMNIFEICRTTDNQPKSVIYSFLNVMSKKFASIPYNSNTIYKGKKRNCRDVFLDLFLDELKKTTPFRRKLTLTDDEILTGLALQFNITIVLFTDKVEVKEIEPESVVKNTVTSDTIYLYRDSDNLFYPIRLNNNPRRIYKNLNTLTRFLGGNVDSEPLQFLDPSLQNTYETKKKVQALQIKKGGQTIRKRILKGTRR